MKDKKLPVNKQYVVHTPESSFLSSILQEIPTADEWICSRLLSMVVRKENVHDEFSMIGNYFDECPFFHIVSVSDEIIRSVLTLSFSDCIEKAINNGYYVSAIVNTKHIHNYGNSNDFLHHIHIYGYNKDEQTICIADHFRKGHFTFEKCSYLEINRSRDIVDSFIAFVKLLPDVRFDLTSEMMISLIQEHINGENLFVKYNIDNIIYPEDPVDSCFFGFKYYDCLIEILRGGRFPYDRPIVLICEHTKILNMLLTIIQRKFVPNIEQLFSLCDDLMKKAELLKYYYIKVEILNHFNDADYNIIRNDEQKIKIIELLLSVKEKERNLLENILTLLRNYQSL